MSFWSKKAEAQAITIPDTVKEELSEIRNTYANIDLRLTKFEEIYMKQEKLQLATRIDEVADSMNKRIEEVADSMNKRIEEVNSKLVTQEEIYKSSILLNSKYIQESQKLIEELQHKQNILEERIAKLPTNQNNYVTEQMKPAFNVPTKQQPSWIKKKVQEPKENEQVTSTINDTDA
jgi:hypothetical protein